MQMGKKKAAHLKRLIEIKLLCYFKLLTYLVKLDFKFEALFL